VSIGDDVVWCSAGLPQVDRDDGIDRLTRASVILTHTDPAMAAMVDDAVCEFITKRTFGRITRYCLLPTSTATIHSSLLTF
jgi:hypothetical protein